MSFHGIGLLFMMVPITATIFPPGIGRITVRDLSFSFPKKRPEFASPEHLFANLQRLTRRTLAVRRRYPVASTALLGLHFWNISVRTLSSLSDAVGERRPNFLTRRVLSTVRIWSSTICPSIP